MHLFTVLFSVYSPFFSWWENTVILWLSSHMLVIMADHPANFLWCFSQIIGSPPCCQTNPATHSCYICRCSVETHIFEEEIKATLLTTWHHLHSDSIVKRPLFPPALRKYQCLQKIWHLGCSSLKVPFGFGCRLWTVVPEDECSPSQLFYMLPLQEKKPILREQVKATLFTTSYHLGCDSTMQRLLQSN